MNSDELIEQLGDDFYELKRLVVPSEQGKFVAYSTKEKALGQTPKEALENLIKLNAIHQGEVA